MSTSLNDAKKCRLEITIFGNNIDVSCPTKNMDKIIVGLWIFITKALSGAGVT